MAIVIVRFKGIIYALLWLLTDFVHLKIIYLWITISGKRCYQDAC
jgi:hypothetical protein